MYYPIAQVFSGDTEIMVNPLRIIQKICPKLVSTFGVTKISNHKIQKNFCNQKQLCKSILQISSPKKKTKETQAKHNLFTIAFSKHLRTAFFCKSICSFVKVEISAHAAFKCTASPIFYVNDYQIL